MLSTSLIPFKNDGGDARHSLTEGREPGRHVVHAGRHKRIIAERRKAVRGDDNRPVDGCDWCFPQAYGGKNQNSDNDNNAGLCEICNHLYRSLGWAKGQTKSGLIRFDKLKKEGEGAGGVLHFYSVKTFLQETTEDANKFVAAKGLMQVSSSSASSTTTNSAASSRDVSEDSLFALSNRDGGSSNGGKRDGDDEGLESSSPAKKQKAAAETGGESGQNNNIEGQQGGGCDEEDDAKDRVLRCLFGNNSLDRETEEYYRENIEPVMAAAREFKQSKIKAAEEKAREEMMSPIHKRLYALQNEKAAIEGKVEEFDALRRTVAQRGWGASMPDEAVESVRSSFKKEMEAIDERLSAERASLTRMEALLADGIKQMQTKIDKDLGLDAHDAIDKAHQQLRERRKREQIRFLQLCKQRESLENESASRSDSPSF